MNLEFFVLALFLGVLQLARSNDNSKNLISSLPGFEGALPFKLWSGYLEGSGSSRLFYLFVEAESSDPSSSPVTAWFNGGPGCSSLDGFWEELGPVRAKKDGNLELRPYRWNQLSNMLFIEAPVGVGMSYSLSGNYNNSDDRTATENAEGLNSFFTLFPQYINNEFRIAGESYAGIYIPTLAEQILDRQIANTWSGPSLSGIAVGNGCTGTESGVCGFYEGNNCIGLWYEYQFLAGFPFFKQSMKKKIDAACDWDGCRNLVLNSSAPSGSVARMNYTLSTTCLDLLDEALMLISDVNVYDVMGTCDVQDYCASASAAATYGDASVQTHQQGGRASDSQSALLTGLSKARSAVQVKVIVFRRVF